MFTFDDTPNNEVSSVPVVPPEETALTVNTGDLNKESLELINKIIAESDIAKTKDLTYLFNINQNKKTIVRVNKLNELLDAVVDQATLRYTSRPDEISNSDLMTSLKVVQDIIERSTKQVSGVTEAPLIQINQQNNEVNVGGKPSESLGRESRERVKNTIMGLLNSLNVQASPNTSIEIETEDTSSDIEEESQGEVTEDIVTDDI